MDEDIFAGVQKTNDPFAGVRKLTPAQIAERKRRLEAQRRVALGQPPPNTLVQKLIAPNAVQTLRDALKQPARQQTPSNQPLLTPTAGRPTMQPAMKGMPVATITVPGVGRVLFIQRGPGMVANFPGLGEVRGKDMQTVILNARRAAEERKQQELTRQMAPGQAAYEPSQDYARSPNVQGFGRNLTERQRKEQLNANIEAFKQRLSTVMPGSPLSPALGIAANFIPGQITESTKGTREFLGAGVGSAAAIPAEIISETNTLLSDEFNVDEKVGAITNIATMIVTTALVPFGRTLADPLVKAALPKILAIFKKSSWTKPDWSQIDSILQTFEKDANIRESMISRMREQAKASMPAYERISQQFKGQMPATNALPSPNRTAIDVTEQVAEAERKAAEAAKPKPLPGGEARSLPTRDAKTKFVDENWKTWTQGMIADVQRLIDTQAGAGRQYGPLKRALQKSVIDGKPHPSVVSELEGTFAKQQAQRSGTVDIPPIGSVPKAQPKAKTPKAPAAKPTVEPVVQTTTAPSAVPEPPKIEAPPVKEPEIEPEKLGFKEEVPEAERPAAPPAKSVVPKAARTYGVKTPDSSMKVNVREELVEMDDLIESHMMDGKENPLYDQSIQGRERAKTGYLDRSREHAARLDEKGQITDQSLRSDDGPPILDKNTNMVVSGNGRGMAVRFANDLHPGAYESYRQKVTAMHPEAAGMKKPVLVTRIVDDLSHDDIVKFADLSNDPIAARKSPFEEAKADAKIIPDDFTDRFAMVGKTLAEALSSPTNKGLMDSIVGNIPSAERVALFDAEGGLTPAAAERIGRGMLIKILGEDAKPILMRAFEQGEISKRVMGGLEQAAGDLIKLRAPTSQVAVDVRKTLLQAIEYLDEAQHYKDGVKEWIKQESLLPRDDGAVRLMKILSEAKSKEQVGSIVSDLSRVADDAGGGMFGETLALNNVDEVLDDLEVKIVDERNAPLQRDVDMIEIQIGQRRQRGEDFSDLEEQVAKLREAMKKNAGGMNSKRRGAALNPTAGMVDLIAGASGIFRARPGSTREQIAIGIRSILGNASDMVKHYAKGSGKRITQDMEWVATQAAAMQANLGLRLKEAIRSQYGRVPGLTHSSREALGLARDSFNDIVSKVMRGDHLDKAQKKVWDTWVGINKELAEQGARNGVMVDRIVGDAKADKNMMGKRVGFIDPQGIPREGIVIETQAGFKIRTSEGVFKLKYGESYVSETLVDPEFYFPRELRQGIDELAHTVGTPEHQRWVEYLIERDLVDNAEDAQRLIQSTATKSVVEVASPVRSRLRMRRYGDLMPPEFYNRNFAEVAERDIARKAMDIAWAKRWGKRDEKLGELLTGLSDNQVRKVHEAIGLGLGQHQPFPAGKAVAFEGLYQAVTKLSGLQTAVIQMSQLASNIGTLGTKAGMKGLWDVVKPGAGDRRLMHRLQGLIEQDMMSLQGFEDVGGAAKAAGNLILSPMKFVDTQMRHIAAASGKFAVEDALKKIKFHGDVTATSKAGNTINLKGETPNPIGKPVDNASYRLLSDWFKFTDDDIKRMAKEGMSPDDLLMAGRGGVATQVTTRSLDTPVATLQVPVLRMAWRFKTFAYGQARIFGFAAKEAIKGNVTPLIRLTLASALAGEVTGQGKDLVMQAVAWGMDKINGEGDAEAPKPKQESWEDTLAKGETPQEKALAIAERGWKNTLEAGTFGLYKDTFEMVDPEAPAWKSPMPPVFKTVQNVWGAIKYAAENSDSEESFLDNLKQAGMDFTQKEIVPLKQFYQMNHGGRTFRQENPNRKEG
jgi:hypothetical protein